MTIHVAYKKEGETPLECLDRVRIEKGIQSQTKLTYLGRLDPMAEGVLIIGEGLGQEEREKYLNLRKTYTVEVLFGFATDTYDILGKLTDAPTRLASRRLDVFALTAALSKVIGKFEQPYPPYSSKPAAGANGVKKSMFALSQEGIVPEDVPTKEVEVYACQLDRVATKKVSELLVDIQERIKKVKGDFRQQEILSCWEQTLGPIYDQSSDIATITLEVSSGTYIRSIAHRLGKSLGTSALAYRLTRTHVGNFTSTSENDLVLHTSS
jgi:tRNA pseudouridine55 synthase